MTGPNYNDTNMATYFPIENFDNNKLFFTVDYTLTDKFAGYLNNDNHYIFEFTLLDNPSTNFKVFFTLVKKNSSQYYDYEIKNVSPSNLDIQSKLVENIKLYELETKYN